LTEGKEKKATISYAKKIVPVEYEARGVFLGDLLNPDFASKLKTNLGEFDVVSIMIYTGKDMVGLWHKSSEDMKKKMVTVTCKEPETMKKLSKALGLEE
jgi:hypothetical protein